MSLWFGFIFLLQLLGVLSEATKDYRHISYNDLSETTVFHQEGVSTYSQLLFDVSMQQVIVGARDNLFRLTLTSLTPLEHAVWPPSKDNSVKCQNKGQSSDDCHNYIKVLLSNGKRLFACGTNAFSPSCSWREIENINNVTSFLPGVAMCPYSPHSNVTALLSRGPSGGLFVGTPTDFSGNDAAIYRTLNSLNLRTRQYDPKWLNEPQFVGSFETEDYIYFLFRESAVEYINCGKRVYSRIARVCKYDPGNSMVMKDTWTTFSKARLNCSLPGEFPFYYDEIQGAAYQPDQGVVYATFTTPSNAIAGSAICAFNMSAILAAFDGSFKHQENSGAAWERKTVKHNRQQCGPAPPGAGSNHLSDNQLYQLMDEAVQATTQKPLHTAVLERFTHLAVDVTPTKSEKAVAVLYVATSDGLIKKISVLPKSTETCIVEIWGPLPSTPIILQYLKETKSLYVGMQNALLRIPAVQCHRHIGAQACLDSQDPYCGWDEHLLRCSAGSHGLGHWRQEANRCPELGAERAGGWGAWGPWFNCPHGPDGADSCLCQTRSCDNPQPRNGGPDCSGSRVRVINCTQHGGWTAWSAWSSCSQSCGLATKTRRRSCTNPAPLHGGRLCPGREHEESFCIELPPCPALAPRAWSSWGAWSACSRPCAGGFRTRTRSCEPQPSHGPDASSDCPGCNFQVEECNKQPCQEFKKYYTTAWMVTGGNTSSAAGSRNEKRYRFICRAQTDEPSSVKVQTQVEKRHCRADGPCSKKTSLALASDHAIGAVAASTSDQSPWSSWSSWSGCSQSCAGGTQYRIRQCKSGSCESQGLQTESRACNVRGCSAGLHQQRGKGELEEAAGQWSCWSEWSECSVSCGFGLRVRSRDCLGRECSGPSRQSEACEMPSCEFFRGWDSWSAWTACDGRASVQYRRRGCLVAQPSGADCLGPSKQSRWCLADDFPDNDVNALPSRLESSSISFAVAAASCVAAFATGLLLTVLGTFYYMKRRKTDIPSSPHYISRQNPYVTVPLKEINTKRQPSFSGSINGTLRSGKNNSTVNAFGSPKLYPKALEYESATLKRNSREQHLRAELDQEKYY